jgi:hypothetical protein
MASAERCAALSRVREAWPDTLSAGRSQGLRRLRWKLIAPDARGEIEKGLRRTDVRSEA